MLNFPKFVAPLGLAAFATAALGAAGCEEAWEEKHTTEAVDNFNDSVERGLEDVQDSIGLSDKAQTDSDSETIAYLEKRFEKLERNLDKAGDKVEAKSKATVNDLDTRLEKLKNKMENVRSEGAEEWNDVKKSVDQTLAQLEQEFDDLNTES